jgi:hypothetical protein
MGGRRDRSPDRESGHPQTGGRTRCSPNAGPAPRADEPCRHIGNAEVRRVRGDSPMRRFRVSQHVESSSQMHSPGVESGLWNQAAQTVSE